MAHHHFTTTERLEIGILLKKHYSHHDIADALGCSQSSVSREIMRNSVRGTYDARKAKMKARVRRRYSKYQGMKVRERPRLQTFIVAKLMIGWTPEEIAGRLKTIQKDLSYVSAKGIYKWLYSVYGQQYCPYLVTRRRRPVRRVSHAQRVMIPDRIGIEKRQKEANDRSTFGHYEADTAVSGKRHGSPAALSVLHERKARYVRLRKIPNLKPSSHARALTAMAKNLLRKSITFDNGIENRRHADVARALKITTYFCTPYHSWEKGGVENTIGRIRRYIPKGTDIARYTDRDVAAVEHWLNHTPRKCLHWKTPHEIMIENLLFTSPIPSDAFEG